MNACATSRIDASQTVSFAKHFLDHGHLGFIGTEAAIPDMVAAEFSASFYSRLLAGDSLGVALLDARRQLKDWYGNPLGLLYTMYADPRISIEGAPA